MASGGKRTPVDALERGRARYAEHAFEEAYESLSRADDEGALSDPEDLERLAWSAALTGRDDAMHRALERLYQICLDAEEPLRAARWAFWSAFHLVAVGEMGRAGGWLSRAERLVGDTVCVERGYLHLPLVHRHLVSGDFDAARAKAAEAAAIGERFSDPDLVAFARNLEGRALVRGGAAREGLALLDEAMLGATVGELSPLITGLVYCSVIATCQQTFAVDRAREWTEALASWCDANPQLATFNRACLAHRAEVMRLGGDWEEALEEAERACDAATARTPDPEASAIAFYQRGEIHRLRGEHARAEEAYRSASRSGGEPQPGLALLRLAQGRGDEAFKAIRRAVETAEPEWKLPRFLPAYVEIALGVGELEAASEGARRLSDLAERLEVEVLDAMAERARGAVALATGDARGAVEPLRSASKTWQAIGAPYIVARIRVLLAEAYCALDDHDTARLELDAARAVFEALAAAPDLAAMDEAPAEGARADHDLTPRELEVLRHVARGSSNRDIARELCVSTRTIDRHVSNILMKLDVPSRAGATAFAYEHDLV